MTTDSDALPILAFGRAAAATALLLRSRAGSPAAVSASPSADQPVVSAALSAWVFPVPSLGDRRAVISDGFDSPRTDPDGTRRAHLGADLMFRRRDRRDLIAVYPPQTVNGTKWFFMPHDVPALAASAGTVRLAEWTPVGYTVVILHPSGWATYYTHMASLAVARGDQVVAGQTIGFIGGSPADGEHLKHLHFEFWRGGTRAGAVDPAPYLDAWPHVAISNWTPSAPVAPRNAGLTYRPVGDRGELYPEWLRRIRGSSGVYIIRERGGPIVYIGESSTGRLYAHLAPQIARDAVRLLDRPVNPEGSANVLPNSPESSANAA